MPLRKLPEAFGLTASKSWYQHHFNTKANLDYVGPIRDIEYYGADEMAEGERSKFMASYDEQKVKVFDNRHVLEQYCQDDVTVLRQACRVFRREFLKNRKYRGFSRGTDNRGCILQGVAQKIFETRDDRIDSSGRL